MIQSLIIRQVFIIIDFVLALAVIVTAAVVTKKLFTNQPAALLAQADTEFEAVAPKAMLLDVQPRPAYDAILQNRLFGEAGAWDEADVPPPPPPPPVPETVDTDLNLRLLGVSALTPTDPLGSAVIQDETQRSPGVFALGEDIMPDVTLLEIHPRMVILENRKKTPSARERLTMDEEDTPGQMAQHAPGPTLPPQMPTRSNSGMDRIELNKNELIQDLSANYADLVTKVRPEIVTDERGNVVGLTAQNISQVPLAEKLGLQDGDVLQSINNEKIDSEQKILEIMTKYQNAGSFRIGIQRGGQAKVINYRLN